MASDESAGSRYDNEICRQGKVLIFWVSWTDDSASCSRPYRDDRQD